MSAPVVTAQSFAELPDGWYLITLEDGRAFKVRSITSTCPYCKCSITSHDCWPARRERDVES
jgi:Lon protease-like protein